MSSNLQIRPMTRPELSDLVDWAAAEGWNPGLNDAECFWAADPEGFLALDVDGRLAGGGSIVRHNPKFGFMGLFIVRPEFRGRGWGEELWIARRDRLRARLDPDGAIGLDAVEAMVPFYARGGFEPSHRQLRFQLANPATGESPTGREPGFTPLGDLPWNRLAEFDATGFPGPRDAYLGAWIRQPDARALGLVERGRLVGAGLIRRCRTGSKMGPLFADSAEVAARLFDGLVEGVEGPIFIDAPDANPKAIALCEGLGMSVVFKCVRMTLGTPPASSWTSVYGLTSLELG